MSTAEKRYYFNMDSTNLITQDSYETGIQGFLSYEGEVKTENLFETISTVIVHYISQR